MNTDANIVPILALKSAKPTLIETDTLPLIQGGIRPAEFSLFEAETLPPEIGAESVIPAHSDSLIPGARLQDTEEIVFQTAVQGPKPAVTTAIAAIVQMNATIEPGPVINSSSALPQSFTLELSGEPFRDLGEDRPKQSTFRPDTTLAENGNSVPSGGIVSAKELGKNPTAKQEFPVLDLVETDVRVAETDPVNPPNHLSPPQENGLQTTVQKTFETISNIALPQLETKSVEMVGPNPDATNSILDPGFKDSPNFRSVAESVQGFGVVEYQKQNGVLYAPRPTEEYPIMTAAKSFAAGSEKPLIEQPPEVTPSQPRDIKNSASDPKTGNQYPGNAAGPPPGPVENPDPLPANSAIPNSGVLNGAQLQSGPEQWVSSEISPVTNTLSVSYGGFGKIRSDSLPAHDVPNEPQLAAPTTANSLVQKSPDLGDGTPMPAEVILSDFKSAGPISPSERSVFSQLPPEFAQRSVQVIAQAATQLKDRPIELLLNPEELGKVRLTLQEIDGTMTVSVAVERQETLDLLRRHIGLLASQLREIGYQDLKFDFSGQGSFLGQGGEKSDQSVSQPPMDPNSIETETNPLQLYIGPQSGVDIRL